MALPKDLLEIIFSRLPVMGIVCARMVCKLWKDVLCSEDFLIRYGVSSREKWVAVFDESGLNKQRVLILYNATLSTWHRVSLNFLPSEYTDAVATAGGLLCMAGQANGRNVLCVCNPFTRAYKLLPDLDKVESSISVAVMIESRSEGKEKCSCCYQVLVLRCDKVALHSSAQDAWLSFNSGLPCRPRSPVACGGVVYGLQSLGSPWKASWRLVYAKLDELRCKEVWCPLDRPEWGETLDILRQPRLLETDGCLLLTGGLRLSVASYSCSTFIILKLDLSSLEWSEAARMPLPFYTHFDPGADFKIFGGRDTVYFSSKTPGRLVVCDFSKGEGEGVWRWVDDCPAYKYQKTVLCCKGFPFHPRLDASV